MGRGLRHPCCLWGWGRTGAWQRQPPWVQNHPLPNQAMLPHPPAHPSTSLPSSRLCPKALCSPKQLRHPITSLPGAPRSPLPAPNQSPPPWPGARAALTCWGEPSGSQRVQELPCLPGHRGALRAAEKVTAGRVGGCLVQHSCSHRLLPRQPQEGTWDPPGTGCGAVAPRAEPSGWERGRGWRWMGTPVGCTRGTVTPWMLPCGDPWGEEVALGTPANSLWSWCCTRAGHPGVCPHSQNHPSSSGSRHPPGPCSAGRESGRRSSRNSLLQQ